MAYYTGADSSIEYRERCPKLLHSCFVLRGEGVRAMRSINILAGALAVLLCETTEAVSFTGQTTAQTPGFVIGFGSTPVAATASRKRPRGCCSTTAAAVSARIGPARPVSAVAVQVATAGSFTARSGGRGGWFGASTGERSRRYSCGELSSGRPFPTARPLSKGMKEHHQPRSYTR